MSSPHNHYQATVEDVPDEEMDLMNQLREAATSPTPLAEFLQDPDAVHSLTKMSSREYRSSRRGSPARDRRDKEKDRDRDRDRDREKGSGKRRGSDATNSMLSLVLAEEERQAHHLKAMLRITNDRLEHEMRKADSAESRATLADIRAREAGARAMAAEQAQHNAELDAARAREETKRYQMQLEIAEREVRRVSNDMVRLQRQRDEAEEAAAKARDTARKWQAALRDFQAREEGREEGRRLAMFKRYDDGREDGWEEGRMDGWHAGREDGFEEGRRMGVQEGREQGHREERKHAFKMFNRSFESRQRYPEGHERHMEGVPVGKAVEVGSPWVVLPDPDPEVDHDVKNHERIQQWAQSTETSTRSRTPEASIRSRTPSPKPRPVWLHRRVTTDPAMEGRG